MSGSSDGNSDLRSERGEALPDLLLLLCSREAAAGFERRRRRRPPTPLMSRPSFRMWETGKLSGGERGRGLWLGA